MPITPDTIIGSIAVDTLPEGKAKTTVLPGGSPDPRNVLSDSQVRVIASYVHENMDPTITWSAAVQFLRREAGIRTARQMDFPIVEWVIIQSRKATAGEELTVGQQQLKDSCMQALSGVSTHFDAAIAARIRAADPILVTAVLQRFIAATNRGQLTTAMNTFSNLFGVPARHSLDAVGGPADVLGGLPDHEPSGF